MSNEVTIVTVIIILEVIAFLILRYYAKKHGSDD